MYKRQDLQNISEYLTQLDASVTNNKEELIHLTEVHDGNYGELTEYLEGLKNVVSTIQSELAGYQDSQSEQQIISCLLYTSWRRYPLPCVLGLRPFASAWRTGWDSSP